MSKSLELQTQPAYYHEFAKHLRSGGTSEQRIAEIIAGRIIEASKLLHGICPQCGAPIARYVDYQRQQGDKRGTPGAWVQYRCSTAPAPGNLRPPGVCDFMVDMVEGDAAS